MTLPRIHDKELFLLAPKFDDVLAINDSSAIYKQPIQISKKEFFYLRIFHSGVTSGTPYTVRYERTVHLKVAKQHTPTLNRFMDLTESIIKKRTKESANSGRKTVPAGRGIVVADTIELGNDVVHIAVAGVNHQKTRELTDFIHNCLIAPYNVKA